MVQTIKFGVYISIIGICIQLLAMAFFESAQMGSKALTEALQLEADKWGNLILALLALIILVLTWFRFRSYTIAHEGVVQDFRCESQSDPRPCLILLVSTENRSGTARLTLQSPSPSDPAAKSTWLMDGNLFLSESDLENLAPKERLFHAIEQASHVCGSEAPFWPWQQTLRAILPNLSILREVVLIGSSHQGSAESLPMLQRFLQVLLGSDVVVRISPESPNSAPDFEDFDALKQRLDAEFEELTRRGRNSFQADQILIDITGGQKMASVVGACYSLTTELRIQYVATEGTPPAIHAYNLSYVAEPKPIY